MNWVYQRGLILGTVWGAFSGASCVIGVSAPPLFCLPPTSFIVFSFLLNLVSSADTCPISPFLQLLRVVVKAEKYGYVRYKALNAIMAAFPSNISIFSIVLFCFSTFPVPWNDLECHYQWQVAPLVLGYIHAEDSSSAPILYYVWL